MKFKVGDKVKIINNSSNQRHVQLNNTKLYLKGEIATITGLYTINNRHEVDYSAYFKPEELEFANSELIKKRLAIK